MHWDSSTNTVHVRKGDQTESAFWEQQKVGQSLVVWAAIRGGLKLTMIECSRSGDAIEYRNITEQSWFGQGRNQP
jgi:hypothetical protein